MRILVLGGTLFLSRETAAAAVRRGHDVTCAARGESGPVPDGAAFAWLDRNEPDWSALTEQRWDAVVDVARRPSWVREAVDALAEHSQAWLFVSTCSVYADQSTPGQRAGDAPVLPAAADDVDETDKGRYGELKVACEQIAQQRLEGSALVVRPGLIVGPGDPSGRFAYWPRHLADVDEVLAPGSPDDAVQMIDLRDLAEWLVDAAERGLRGTFDAKSPPTTRGRTLDAVARGIDRKPTVTWVDQQFLTEQGVEPWMGPRSLPLWVPLPEYAGFMSRDVSESVAAGLVTRPIEDTARDTLDWLQQTPDATVTGLTLDEERDVLRRWHARSPTLRP